jgi:hypothetical protein
MKNCLPKYPLAANASVVLHLLARMILAFAFIASTAHAPAIAHDNLTNHHVDHGGLAAHDAVTDLNGDSSPSHDGSGESLHHHHCPTALGAACGHGDTDVTVRKAVMPFHRASPLSSLSQAPPTEPPSA